MKRIAALLIASLIAITVITCTQGEQRVSLRFKYEPGTVLTYKQHTKRAGVILAGDSVVEEFTSDYTVDLEHKYTGYIDDSTAKIEEKGIVRWVEPNKDDSTVMDSVSKVHEAEYHCLTNGKLLKIDILSEKDPVRMQRLERYYEQALPVFPDGEKPIGYSWTQTTRVMLPDESLEASTTYEIKSLVRESGYDCALIAYKGNLVLPSIGQVVEPHDKAGVDRIDVEGLIYFAYKEGFAVLQTESFDVTTDHCRGELDEKGEILKVATKYDIHFALVKVDKQM